VTNSIALGQIQRFVAAWYQGLDIHAPIEECYKILADDGLNMQFPDGYIRDHASFKKWYDRVTNLFFDEKHTIRNIESGPFGPLAHSAVFWSPGDV